VAAIRIDRSRLKRKVLLLFPTVCSVESNETGGPIKTGLIENTSLNQLVDSVATILEQETQATINDWFRRNMGSNLLVGSPLEESVRPSHLPELFRDLVNRLRHPLPLMCYRPMPPRTSYWQV